MHATIALASLPECLFHAQTRGGLYQITVTKLGDYNGVEHFDGKEWRSGRSSGSFPGVGREHCALRVAQAIHDAAFCDGHKFAITKDTLGVAGILASADKSTWFPARLVNAALEAPENTVTI